MREIVATLSIFPITSEPYSNREACHTVRLLSNETQYYKAKCKFSERAATLAREPIYTFVTMLSFSKSAAERRKTKSRPDRRFNRKQEDFITFILWLFG